LRRYDRVEAASGSLTHFTRSTGEQIRCEVIDLPLSGVSLRTDLKAPIGEHILIGHRAGRIARHHEDGVGIEFLGASLAAGNPTESPPAPVSLRTMTSSAAHAAATSAVAAARRR